jgi:hypothetical protein
MNIGWPRTFGLDLDLIRRALPFYASYPNAGRTETEGQLGIGGQKVQGLNSWLKYLGLRDSRTGQLSPLAQLLWRVDPSLTDRATLCVLHYVLVSNPEATVWYEIVNHFLPGRDSFSTEDLKSHFDQPQFAESSAKQLTSDRGLFLSTYTGTERRALQALDLFETRGSDYIVQPIQDVPALVLGYCLYDRRSHHNHETTTEIRRLLHEAGSPGILMRMPEEALRRGLAVLESAGLVSIIRIADIDGVAYVSQASPLQLLEQHYQSR